MKWITALNLEQWAKMLDARTVFPGLIGDLIRASAKDITSFRFALGDKSQIRGFDGRLESSGFPPFVPEGKSIWEFGSSGATTTKANSDYNKRTKEVSEDNRMNSTLVIASPYTWDTPNKKLDDWLNEKRDKNEWKQVEYFDGIVIESWLDEHPAVAARYARYELGLSQIGVLSTEEFWDEYSARFHPQLSEDVLLCDRQSQADKLLKALVSFPGMVTFVADSPEEVIAFAVAALRKSEPATRLFLEARTIIVENQDAARLMAAKEGLAFIPKGHALKSAGMLARAGSTIVGIGRNEPNANHEILNRPSNTSMGKAIAAMGFADDEGYQYARKCGRSVTVLARLIKNGSVEPPEWMEHGKQLLPALLAGGWSAISELDTGVLRDLGGKKNYEEIEAYLRPLTHLTDPPIDRIEDVWKMRAPVDAFVYLGHMIGADDLRRLKEAAIAVFGKIEDLPNPDDLFQPKQKESTQYSDWLRDGLATTLLQIAVLHSQAKLRVPGSTPQDYVNDIIRNLPGLSSNHRLLDSLRDELPLLAEAAPDPFLGALEAMLEGKGDLIKPIFSEQEHFLSPSSPHTGLLWALEVLAWDPELLPRVALILAKLAAIDPGGRLSNRPIRSLGSIFLSWAPNTNATLKQRLGILDYIIKNTPSIGWELLVILLPKQHGISVPSAKPKFREAAASGAENLTYGLVWESQREIIDRTLVQADGRAERLIIIIDSMHNFEPAAQIEALVLVESFLAKYDHIIRESVWAALRDEANKNKAFSDADWAIKNNALNRIDQIVKKYQPADVIALNVWLFNDWSPNLPGKLDDLEETLSDARILAVKTVLADLGIEGILQLAEKSKLPQLVAPTLENIEIDVSNYVGLVEKSLQLGDKLEHFASIVSSVAYKKYSSQWVTLVKKMAINNSWSYSVIARLLFALPDEREIWEIVADFGSETEVEYWRNKHPHYFKGGEDDFAYLAKKYLEVGRPIAAIDALYRQVANVSTPLLLTLLDNAISEINQRKDVANNMLGYNVEKIFESLESRNDVDAEKLAQLEYVYLPLLDRPKKPLTLHRLLMKNAELYVSVIKDVFKPASGKERESSEESRARAHVGYHLLNSIKALPGQNGDKLDFDVLYNWCLEARHKATEFDRAVITDQYIGHILAHAPVEKTDNAWPHSAVRCLLEKLCSDEIEHGIVIERHNMRGFYSKSIDEGGAQERALAEQSRSWSKVMTNYPRTVKLLTQIARDWEKQAEQEDIRMEKDRLKW